MDRRPAGPPPLAASQRLPSGRMPDPRNLGPSDRTAYTERRRPRADAEAARRNGARAAAARLRSLRLLCDALSAAAGRRRLDRSSAPARARFRRPDDSAKSAFGAALSQLAERL